MRTAVSNFNVYKYEELSQEAKEKVKEWLLDDDTKPAIFTENCNYVLLEDFPNSDLAVKYSLSNCQGDGLNIEGTVNLYDVLPRLEGYSEKEIKTLKAYFKKIDNNYEFAQNNRYNYSCKFIDRQSIGDLVEEAKDELECWQYENIDIALIAKFYTDMINLFEKKESEFKKSGYAYFYEIDEDEAIEICNSNGYEFFENGNVCQTVYVCNI